MIDDLSEITWHSPLLAGEYLANNNIDFTLLYSAKQTNYSGEFSYIAWGNSLELISENIDILNDIPFEKTPIPTWFGRLNYEANHKKLNILEPLKKAIIPTAAVHFIKYQHVIKYHHESNKCFYQGANPSIINEILAHKTQIATFPTILTFQSNYNYEDYLEQISATIEQIYAGNFYQANITTKFYGELSKKLTQNKAICGFGKLCELSPAPYASFIANDGLFILSSSPELFVKIDEDRNIFTRPIKGTAATSDTNNLATNSKTMAENLMIVDLMRNDLATKAMIGSVQVPAFLEVDNFANLRHLSSTISAILPHNFNMAEVISEIFPPGSMTGAPKISSMQWIADIEQSERGVYSGAIGWINGSECELSVTIRTLIARENIYEIQFGGGITADSNPDDEYQELLTKAKAMFALLEISQ
jgi:para-aminobenzoate synthetase component I